MGSLLSFALLALDDCICKYTLEAVGPSRDVDAISFLSVFNILLCYLCSTWTDGTGALLSQINYTLTNISSSTALCSLGLAQPANINQIWNVTNTGVVKSGYTVFALPSWVTQAGGIAAGGNTTFGGIFNISGGSPKWIVFS